MKLDKNYISATIRFLKLLNFKFETKKVGKLNDKLHKEGKLLIYDSNNNEVGKLFVMDNYNCMDIRDLESKLSVTSYRNLKEKLSYVFRYNIFKFYTRESIDGYYEIKKENNDFLIESNYKISKNNVYNLKYSFNNIKNEFSMIDYKTLEKVKFNKDSFDACLKMRDIKIEYYNPDIIYYESLDKTPYQEENKVGGYISNDNSSFENEISNVLHTELKEYFEYINEMKDKSDNVLPNFYEDNINAVLTRDSDSIKKSLFLNKK